MPDSTQIVLAYFRRVQRIIILLFSCLFITQVVQGQNLDDFDLTAPSAALLIDANAVVLQDIQELDIPSSSRAILDKYTVYYIRNKSGWESLRPEFYYSEGDELTCSLSIYDADDERIFRARNSDFEDVTTSGSGADVGDGRVRYVSYQPASYPITLVLNSKQTYKNTAFIPEWSPVPAPYVSVVSSTFQVSVNDDLQVFETGNALDSFNVKRETTEDGVQYSLTQLPIVPAERGMPRWDEVSPWLRLGLNKFRLVDESVEAIDMNTLGSFYHQKLLQDLTELSPEVVEEVNALTAPLAMRKDKVAAVYRYMQDRMRYVSIQLGIGGWVPEKAQQTHKLGYGDCKALTYYTKSLLESQGIPSYYTVVQANAYPYDIENSGPLMQGNHVILSVPQEDDELLWLECTTKTNPADYLGLGTQDRQVWQIRPEGGAFVRTPGYWETTPSAGFTGALSLTDTGALEGTVAYNAEQLMFDQSRWRLDEPEKDVLEYYAQETFSHLNGVTIKEYKATHDRENPSLEESFQIEAPLYVRALGKRYIIQPVALSRLEAPGRQRADRVHPYRVQAPTKIKDEYTIQLPDALHWEKKTAQYEHTSVAGTYSLSIREIDGALNVKRELELAQNTYPATDYNKIMDFFEAIEQADKTKIILVNRN